MEKVFHILKLYSIYSATVILLLHTFIPHSHDKTSNDPGISCEKKERCIIDFLGAILEHDFGADHLKHFQIQDNLQVDFDNDYLFKKDEVVVIDLFSDFKVWDISELTYQNQSADQEHKRGPPSYS